MAGYWPTPLALQNDPVVAERMNSLQKIVFSKTLTRATWSNTRLTASDPVKEVCRLKQESGDGMAILGSGSLVSQLTRANLIDEFQIVVNPVILGKGRTMFEDLEDTRPLRLTASRAFRNGNVYLCYAPRA
jgi:dihydrofolate reductase